MLEFQISTLKESKKTIILLNENIFLVSNFLFFYNFSYTFYFTSYKFINHGDNVKNCFCGPNELIFL